MSNDYPDGFRRLLPGHTVDLTTGFARPWHLNTTLTVAAAGTGNYTVRVNDPDSIYYIDVANASPQAYTEFGIRVFINGDPYVAEGCSGFAYIPMRVNPSILLIYGDIIVVQVTNYDASSHDFLINLHGTKITKPAGFGHAPEAYFTADRHLVDVLCPAVLTENSAFSPTSWEWDFRDGQPKVTTQNTNALYKTPGSRYPLLKAFNQYGYDTFAEQVPIVCNPYLLPPVWSIVDPGGYVTRTTTAVTVTALPSNIDTYVFLDLVGRLATSFRFKFKFECSLFDDGAYYSCIGYGNSLSSANNETINYVSIIIFRTGAAATMMLAYYNVADVVYDIYTGFPYDGTPLYLDLYHSAGSDTVSLNIYSDAAMTVLVDSLSITHSDLSTTSFRYCYLARNISNAGAPTKTVKLDTIIFQYQ